LRDGSASWPFLRVRGWPKRTPPIPYAVPSRDPAPRGPDAGSAPHCRRADQEDPMNRSPSRREFLAIAPALVVAPARKPGLTLGFSTYGLPKLPVSKAVALIASIGFDSVELAVIPDRDSAPTKLDQAMRKALRKQLGDSGLKLTALMESLTPSPSWREQATALDRLRRAADLATSMPLM
jgi:hypothetical protein